jgi:hypothetical protein
LWGTQTLGFDATDTSGIAQVTVAGSTGRVAYSAPACDFQLAQPCPELSSGMIGIDTTQLHDGQQTLALAVTNAAGNTTSVQTSPVVIDNNGPPPPTSVSLSPIAGSTTSAKLTWSAPTNPPEPVTGAQVQLCAATCGSAQAVSTSGTATVAVPGPGTFSIRLWLTDSAGRGSAAQAALANVSIPNATSGGGSGGDGGAKTPLSPLHLTTALHGRQLAVAVSGPKRDRITIKWTADIKGREVAHASRTVVLSSAGRVRVTWELGQATAKRATVHISASLGHDRPVTRTLG